MILTGKTFLNFSLYKTCSLVDHNPFRALRISDFIHFTNAESSSAFKTVGRSGEVMEAGEAMKAGEVIKAGDVTKARAVVTFPSLLAFEIPTDKF